MAGHPEEALQACVHPTAQTVVNENALDSEKMKEYSEHEIEEEDPATDDNVVKVVHNELRWGRYFLSELGISLKELCQP